MSVVRQIATIVTTLLSLKSCSFTEIDGPHLQAVVQLCQKGPVGKMRHTRSSASSALSGFFLLIELHLFYSSAVPLK